MIAMHMAVVGMSAVAIFLENYFLKQIFWKLVLRSGLFWEKWGGGRVEERGEAKYT